MVHPLSYNAIRSSKSRLRYDTVLLVFILPVALVTYYCTGHLDSVVSLFVRRYLFANKNWSQYTSSIPDALLILVVLITVGAYSLYRYRLSSGELDVSTITYKMLAITAPVSFIAKSIMKYFFGRITTREWLLTPHEFGFHWFHGGERYSGFPSGHMAVFTALIAVLWRLHPRCRPVYLAVLLLLALALITTNYHFLSDVVAGTYLGLLIEACTWRIVGRNYRF